jgi:hypothetical protein
VHGYGQVKSRQTEQIANEPYGRYDGAMHTGARRISGQEQTVRRGKRTSDGIVSWRQHVPYTCGLRETIRLVDRTLENSRLARSVISMMANQTLHTNLHRIADLDGSRDSRTLKMRSSGMQGRANLQRGWITRMAFFGRGTGTSSS